MSSKQAQRRNSVNRKTGSFYTPAYIAEHIARNSLNAWFRDKSGIDLSNEKSIFEIEEKAKSSSLNLLKELKVVDPAVGDGVFLTAAGEWIQEARLALEEKASISGIRKEVVTNCLYGVDLMTEAVEACKRRLRYWVENDSEEYNEYRGSDYRLNVKQGNALIGGILRPIPGVQTPSNEKGLSNIADQFHWFEQFPNIMKGDSPGFDVLLGNPPYGNILSREERNFIKATYSSLVGGGRDGSWNVACQFIVRSRDLLRDGGQFGFLIPNSILRVGQFAKTRKFLLDNMTIWEIIDEGSPFKEVTLEMVSLMCKATKNKSKSPVRILSRREGIAAPPKIPYKALQPDGVFVLYFDDVFERVLEKGKRDILEATRGRDIPKKHASTSNTEKFQVPYATSGRSVKRYRLEESHLVFVDNWFKGDKALKESYDSQLLIATKNYPYPRCVVKPVGMIHGGGAVKIMSTMENFDHETLGLILNSRMIRYICIKYLTNYSQLTTCLNTGIMNNLPLVYPKNPEPYARIYKALETYHQDLNEQMDPKEMLQLERLADALVYDLYLNEDQQLNKMVSLAFSHSQESGDGKEILRILDQPKIQQMVEDTYGNPIVKLIDSSPRM
ncbi:MAG: Eco57I restriction-modification methylase domain-containing protein [Candidatus Thorarchaeota archaeon]|jgi:hypothetical protein